MFELFIHPKLNPEPSLLEGFRAAIGKALVNLYLDGREHCLAATGRTTSPACLGTKEGLHPSGPNRFMLWLDLTR